MNDEEYQWNQELLEKEANSQSEEDEDEAGEAGFGGAPGGEESGGEEFGAGEEAGAEPEPPVSPESISFDITNIDTQILKEWNSLDENIKNRYRDKSLRENFKRK